MGASPYTNGPWASREEQLTTAALQATMMPSSVVRRLRPPVPPPPTAVQHASALTVQEVLNISRQARVPTFRSWVSGAPNMVTKSQLTDDSREGSGRNSMRSMD